MSATSIEVSRAESAEATISQLLATQSCIIANIQINSNTAALIASQGILASQSVVVSQNTMDIAALQGKYGAQSASSVVVNSALASLQTVQSQNVLNIANEIIRAEEVENTLASLIATIRIEAAPTIAQSIALTNEITRATAAELVLTNSIASININPSSSMSTYTGGNFTVPNGTVTDMNDHIGAMGSWFCNAFGGDPTNPDGSAILTSGSLATNIGVYRKGSIVTLMIEPSSAVVSNGGATAIYAQRLPAWAIPSVSVICSVVINTNGRNQHGSLMVTTDGSIVVAPANSNGYMWTGASGFPARSCVSYILF